MHTRASRLYWILGKLKRGDRKMFEFDLPNSPGRLFSDAILLERFGYITITLGRVDANNILHLVKMPTEKELDRAYVEHCRKKISASYRREGELVNA